MNTGSLLKSAWLALNMLCCCHYLAAAPHPTGKPGHTLATGIFWLEDFTFANATTADTGPTSWTSQYTGSGSSPAARFGVHNNEFRANNITINGEGIWTSGIIDISGKTDVSVAAEVRSGVDPGGTLDDDNSEHYDYIRLYYKLDSGAEVLFSEYRGAINNNSSINTVVNTTSLNGATLQIIIRARATATDEYYYFDNITVSGTDAAPDATATGGTLTCANSSLTLSGSSATAGVTYSWTGPGGFSSTDQNPVVSVPGIYTLTVNLNAVIATDTALVTENKTGPANVNASASEPISCNVPGVFISGNSSTPAVSYSWEGPNGFSSSNSFEEVFEPGNYLLTVTNPVNGCTATATAVVAADTVTPAGITASNDGPLSCSQTVVTLTGSSATADVDYGWQFPDGNIVLGNTATVTEPGTYTLLAVKQSNGCISTVNTVVQGSLEGCSAAERSATGTVTALVVADIQPAHAFLFKAYPNPVNRSGIIEFTAAQNGRATVGIYNTLGVCEKVLFNNNVRAGQPYKLSFNSGALPAGVYYYVINAQGKRYAQKLLITK